jgi:hypothetical protein
VDDGRSKTKMNDSMTQRMGSARVTKGLFAKNIFVLTPEIRDHQVTPIDAKEFSKLFNLYDISSYKSKLYIF